MPVSRTVEPAPEQVATSTQAQLTKSFDGAEAIAAQNPQYADAITAAARDSFLQGDQWAYTAGIIAVLLGAALVAVRFPGRDEERRLLTSYAATDSGAAPAATS
jgi:MFS transporter, DHA2 family, multidrug resistance protein